MKKRIILIISLLVLIVNLAILPVNAYTSDMGSNYYSNLYFKYVKINDTYITEDDTIFTWDGNSMTINNQNVIDNSIAINKSYTYNQDYTFSTIYNSVYDNEERDITKLEFITDIVFLDTRTDEFTISSGYSFDIDISFTLIMNGLQVEKNISLNQQNNYSLSPILNNNLSNTENRGVLQLRNFKIVVSNASSVLVATRKTNRDLNYFNYKINQWYEEQGLLTPIIIENVTEENSTNFMAWITAIFSAIGGFFNIKLGDTTIGSILLIPLMLSIIFVILKVWRGGSA